jgi:hypothetical protein
MRCRRQSVHASKSKRLPEIGNDIDVHMKSEWEFHCADPESSFQYSIMRIKTARILSYLKIIKADKKLHPIKSYRMMMGNEYVYRAMLFADTMPSAWDYSGGQLAHDIQGFENGCAQIGALLRSAITPSYNLYKIGSTICFTHMSSWLTNLKNIYIGHKVLKPSLGFMKRSYDVTQIVRTVTNLHNT